MTTPAFQANFKTGAGYDASLINVYADTADEFAANLNALVEAIPQILVVQQQMQAGGAVAAALPLAPEQPPQPSAAPPQVVAAPPVVNSYNPAPVAGAPEVVNDRYGNRYTYGLADAPLLPDGRGNYIRKDWTGQNGKTYKAWVDPAKGPKPFQKGATEAEIVWIR